MRADRDAEFEAFVRRQRPVLLRTATLMTSDAHHAEDVVQTTLVKLYLAWGRARRTSLEGYARRTLVRCVIDETRRPHRRERVAESVPDRAAAPVPDGTDPELVAALATLPVGMRTAVVLRHVEDLDVAQTAAAMGCSTGNVKSQTARGLERLRALLTDPQTHPHQQGADR